MNTKQKTQLADFAGADIARQVERKLKELAAMADGLGLHKKGRGILVDRLKQKAGWSELDERRAAARKVEQVQQLVSDFTTLATEALAEGETDIQPLIDELSARLELDGTTDKERLQVASRSPWSAWQRKSQRQATGLAAALQAAAGGAPAARLFNRIVATNQNHGGK